MTRLIASLLLAIPWQPVFCQAGLEINESASVIEISSGQVTVLTYHKAEVPPPASDQLAKLRGLRREPSAEVLERYRRSGFIHPIRAPHGGVLTGMHPGDHLHHFGLWHAWVKCKHRGREVDFWNVGKGQGTIRYQSTKDIRRPGDAAGFTVVQQFVSFTGDGEPEVVLSEDFSIDVRVRDGRFWIDHVTTQTNVTDAVLELPAYRYGGCIAYRSPTSWNKDNSNYLTSEGLNRDGHATRAKWCAMTGPTEFGDATLAILGHPDNHDAPQRQRIWPAKSNNGTIFFNFVPIQETGWQLKPGIAETMRYRIVAGDGRIEPAVLDEIWQDLNSD